MLLDDKKNISTSILSCNLTNLKKEIEKIDRTSSEMIHFDIMDGNFVPNLTFGHHFIKPLRNFTDKIFDVHLMVNNPENFIENFASSGADLITFHYEASKHPERTLAQIKDKKILAGLSLIPSTSPHFLEYLIEKLDLILIMTVNPGFGGQEFLNSQLKKIEFVRKLIDKSGKKVILQVDGGINDKTIKLAANAGADCFVSGSYIISGDYQTQIDNLKNAI